MALNVHTFLMTIKIILIVYNLNTKSIHTLEFYTNTFFIYTVSKTLKLLI